jgi:nitrogenase molybdenum-iron protein NifN
MTAVVGNGKACTVNPLKLSPALGGALAFLGLDRCLPLIHGSQGCCAFALVLMVRHFREAIPLQTTAMSELSTILGGADNVEQAIGNIYARAHPEVIGICSTALTETRDEDLAGEMGLIMARHPEWQDLDVVLAPTPDFAGGLEDGWSRAVEAMVTTMVPAGEAPRTLRQINVLPGSHLTPADVEEVKDLIEGFGLEAIVLPDLSDSLDGHVPKEHTATTLGGTRRETIRAMGRSVLTIAIGEQMRPAAAALADRTGVPYRLFDHLTGLPAADHFIATLMEVSGSQPSGRLRRQRQRLVDAMLDGHFHFQGRRAAIGAEPDQLLALATLLTDLGATVGTAVTTTNALQLAGVPAERVIVGDIDDLEQSIDDATDLIIGPAHAASAAERRGLPLFRAGYPVFDRLGAAQRVSVGYRGTRELIFTIANLFLDHQQRHGAALTPQARLEPMGGGAHAQAQAG